jgi:Transposase DDE domain
MLLDKLFQPFVQKTPIAVMARAALERTLDPQHLDELFERTAQRQYTHELMFSSLVDLMARVVLGEEPSVHAAYRKLQEQFPVSDQSVYSKLQHVELAVSAALVHDSAQRLLPVIEQLDAALPPLLPGYRVRFLDGNHLAATEHRLAELRHLKAGPLPGFALVVLDQEYRLATNVLLSEDGHAQERSLLEAVYPLVRPRDLWVADRNFCTVGFLCAVAQRQGFFALRQHGSLPGKLVGQRRPKGRCDTGRLFEQRFHVPDADGNLLRLRRITVVLDKPTRDGDTEIHILTNLPASTATAATVADLYRQRWTIEGLFFEMSQTLSCEINTLCYPKAALFAFCLGLLASNAVALLKAALRAVHGEEAVSQRLSPYYLALEIRQTYPGMLVAIPAVHWEVFRDLSAAKLAKVLRDLAGQVSLHRYRKTPRGPKKPPPKRVPHRKGKHVSTAQIITDRRRR